MIKLGVARKFVAILANVSLLFNSFVPFLLAIKPAYAQEAIIPEIVVPTPTPEIIPTIEPSITPTPTVDPINVEIGVLVPPIEEPTPTPTPEIIPTIEPSITQEPSPEISITPTPTEIVNIEPVEVPVLGAVVETPVFEKICLTSEPIVDSSTTDWNFNPTTGIYETKENVKIGTRYIFPGENKVTVTFKCLPKNENDKSTLKIQQIKTADLALPDTMGSVGEYAYDITTGMKDGNFEYDVTLPKPSDSTAEISYIEKSIDEARSNLTFFDINKINSNVEQAGDIVKASSIDHFTIYIVKTYDDATLSVLKSSYNQGETVFIKGESLAYLPLRIVIRDINHNIVKTCPVETGLSTTCSHTLPTDASLGAWSVDLERDFFGWEEKDSVNFEVVSQNCTTVCPVKTFSISHQVVDTPEYIEHRHCTNWDGWGNHCHLWGSWESGSKHNPDKWKQEERTIPATYKTESFGPISVVYEKSNDRNKCHRPTGSSLNVPNWAMNDFNNQLNEWEDYSLTAPEGYYLLSGVCYPKVGVCVDPKALNYDPVLDSTEIPDNTKCTYTPEGICPSTCDYLGSNDTIPDGLGGYKTCPATDPCYVPSCRNGIVDTIIGEECDDDNSVNTDACTNDCKLAKCGDNFVQIDNSEQCDGTDGVTAGVNFCAPKTCKLIPIYNGSDSCPNGTVKSATPVFTKTINSKDVDGEIFSLTSGGKYLFEASGTFNPTLAAGYQSDAGYTLINGSLSTQYGINGSGNDYAAHALLADLGDGVGVFNWGSYNPSHTYSKYFSPTSSNVQFVISDRYGDWFDTVYQNQAGMGDNSGSLNLNVYECKSTGSITFIKDANPDNSQSFHFTYGTNDYRIGDFDLVDDNNGDNSQTVTFNSIPSGTYSWTESTYSDWDLTGIRCSDSNSTWNLNTKTINVNLEPGEDITCTITNTKQAKLTIIKQVDTNNDGTIENANATDWTWDIKNGEQNIATGQSRVLGAGSYTITEDQKSDYQLKQWICTNKARGITNSIGVTLNPGDDITCTITNTRKTGSIRVCKVILDSNGNIVDGSALPGSSFSISGLDQSTSQGAPAGVLGTTNFVTPLTYSAKLFGSSVNNAICTTYTNLVPGNYYYGEESLPQDFWATPKYNDGTASQNNINDHFYEYSGQLFDGNPSNDGSRQTSSDGHIVLAAGQQNRTLIILNQYKFGNVNVTKFNDLDGDGQQDGNESNLSGWTINLTGQSSVVTNSDGIAAFNKINFGDYILSETIQPGWLQTNIICEGEDGIDNDNSHQISLTAGQNLNCKIGNRQLGNVIVYKFNDLNGNGTKDEDEPNLSGWTINLTGQTSIDTDENGQANFNNLVAGSYDLSENLDSQPGWTQTNIYCEDSSNGVKITKTGEAYGHHGMCSGWNECKDAVTCALWACESKGYTNLVSYGESKKCPEFDKCNLFYSSGGVQTDWGNGTGWCTEIMGVTDIVCSNGPSDGYSGGYISGNNINLTPGQTKTCYIGNQLLPPTATISKSNNVLGALNPGNSVEFTINLNISGNDVTGFNVTDLLSDGFKYRAGSYKVFSSRLGDITNDIDEPKYHSPGVWNLGDLEAGDKLVLTYFADISNDQQAGKYADLAWASGNAKYGDKSLVLATAEETGKIATNFVGTQVPVVKNTQESVSAGVEKTETIGQVLGVNTDELPGTGAATIWLIISTLLGIAGFSLLKISKKTMLTILLTILSFGLLVNPSQAITENIVVRVEEPKTPTNIKDIELKFVVLDISGGSITAKCFKKGPTDSNFAQFGSDIFLTAGGNSSHCDLNSAINDNGTYQFYVTANSATSDTVSLDYKTSTPGTPNDYRKEEVDDCSYKIHFKTADDNNKTIKVELYRSTSTDFSANDGSLVHSVDVGSNQEKDIINTVPDCSKTYYYVVRAFDNAGNGSGVVGDTVTKNIIINTTTTTSPTSGAIPLIGDNNIPKESEINEPTSAEEQGTVLGVETPSTKNIFAQFQSFIGRHKFSSALTAILVLVIIGYVFKRIVKKKE